MSKKKKSRTTLEADPELESFELDEAADSLESQDLWDLATSDEFEFESQVNEELEETPTVGDIGLLLSVISKNADKHPPEQVDADIQPADEEDPEPTFETHENEGDEVAIRELAADVEMRTAYLNDALNCLSSMEQAALELDSEPGNKSSVQQFCRDLHTLKGASASVGLSEMATYLHELETSLEELFQSDSTEIDVEPMFSAVDRVRSSISALVPSTSETTESVSASPQNSSNQDFSGFGSNDDSSIRIRAAKLDRLMDMLAELVVLRNRRDNHASEFNELNEELNRCATRLRFAEEQPESLADFSKSSARNGSQTITEIGKDITAVAQGLCELQTPVTRDNLSISRFIRDFRQELMQLRRVPISGLLQRLQRAVRDAANAESKKVQLKILGEQTGLEQEIQERLFEPLLHIVRNAVSHGIESPEQRIQSQKNEMGTVTVNAHSNAQQLVIEVRDDGRGIDYAAVRNRAIEKGLITCTQPITNPELAKLIFHPGFSTRESASEISGRGVGMDIVAAAIEQLRGRIDIESKHGIGTTMQITIPLRTGIEHVMVFRCANQLFALPMQSVKAVNAQSNAICTPMNLSEVLSLGRVKTPAAQDVLMLRSSSHEVGGKHLALAVDETVGPEEVVLRGLPPMLQGHPLFCGITLSGAGESVLLLDSQRLEDFCHTHFDVFHQASEDQPAEVESAHRTRALVVDDSLTARKVLVKKLHAMGIASIEAGDGIEALEQLRRENVDIVFTDLDMPRLGGIELLSDIRSQKYTEAPVVIISSRHADEFQSRAIELGAAAYLSKPIEHESFTQLMEVLQQQIQPTE